MITQYIDGTKVETNVEDITTEELRKYYQVIYDYVKGRMYDVQVIRVEATDDEGKIDLSFDRKNTMKFERLDRVNNVAPSL